MPNFCPECGSSQATSRFCSACGYSLASTPAPPDARTRVEETPVFRPFASPVVETWESLAGNPWSSTAGAAIPPPVRNVVARTPVDVSETKLTALKWLWRVILVVITAYGAIECYSTVGKPFFNTSTPSDALSVVLFVALLALVGVAANAARQAGSRVPHPLLTIILVIGAGIAAHLSAGLISPEYRAGIEISALWEESLDRRLLYGFALVLENLAFYAAVLAPVVALSKALEGEYLVLWLEDGEPARFGWWLVLGSGLVLGAHDVVTTGLVRDLLVSLGDDAEISKWKLALFAVPLFLYGNLHFKKRSDIEEKRAAKAAQERAAKAAQDLAGEPEPRGFWRVFRWWFLFIIGGFAVVALLMLLAAFLTSSSG